MPTLKDGTKTDDPRLDRLIDFDERSRNFSIAKLVGEVPLRGRTHYLEERLDQGSEGACVGFGTTHEIVAYPQKRWFITPEEDYQLQEKRATKFARERIYWRAQEIDQWEGGAYPNADPFYEGTSVLAGVKVAKRRGYYGSYHWAFSVEEIMSAIVAEGPVIMGTNWYRSMYDPRPSGLMEVDINSGIVGGHCWLVRGLLMKPDITGEGDTGPVFRCTNSWGETWGVGGEFFLKVADMEALLNNDGEAVLPINRAIP